MRTSYLGTIIILFIFGILLLVSIEYFRDSSHSLIDETIILNTNDALLSTDRNIDGEFKDGEFKDKDQNKFHMVTNIHLFPNEGQKRANGIDIDLQNRLRNIEFCLQRNLNHDKIAAVHVLYYHPNIANYLLGLKLENSSKLVLHLTTRETDLAVNLDYIQKYLRHKYIMLVPSDNYLGEGWDTVDFEKFRKADVMYALTRHDMTGDKFCNATYGGNCNSGSSYVGANDMFVWYTDRFFNQMTIEDLHMPPTSHGVGNRLIYYFINELEFNVLNPCRRLKFYHYHCINVKEMDGKRYDDDGKSGVAPFNDELYYGVFR